MNFKAPFGLYRVAGSSMLPTYRPGDILLGLRWGRPRPRRVVVARAAGLPVVKRLIRYVENRLWLEGDNAAVSTDSRSYGALELGAYEATIIGRIWRLRQ